MLVPLTSSLYVPGKLGDTSHVIVDVGTGYYVKKVSGASAASGVGETKPVLPIAQCAPPSWPRPPRTARSASQTPRAGRAVELTPDTARSDQALL